MNRDARILISGAGIAGLTCAIWLGRSGFKPVVVEKAPRIRADGFIISFSHHAYRFAQQLGLMPALRERDARILSSSYHDRSGRALLTLDYERLFAGVDVLQIMRDDLETVLFDNARDLAEFRFDTTATRIDQAKRRVDVTFSDGRQESFDLMIGADGLHSATRELAFDATEFNRQYLGLSCAAYRLPNFLAMRQKFETHMEASRYMVIFTSQGNDLAAVFVWASDMASAPPAEQRWQHLCEMYDGAADLVAQTLAHRPDESPIYMDPLIQIELPSWHKRRVVVLGDAAHCLTLLSGQGASAAFSDASRLSLALAEHEPEDAFRIYENAMRPIITELQPTTRRIARWYVPRSPLRHAARDAMLRYLPESAFRALFRYKYTKA